MINYTPTPNYYDYIKHSGVKGMTWGDHKYIRKANGSYYYPEGSNAAKVSEYKKGDPDFDEKNYNNKNRLGNTDFYAFTRPDGKVVILQEDMKWELPNGQKISPEMIKRLEGLGAAKSNDEFINNATNAISGGSNGKLSEKDIDNLSNEVIRGNFKNGNERKALLGEHYQQVQDMVNKKLKNLKKKKK